MEKKVKPEETAVDIDSGRVNVTVTRAGTEVISRSLLVVALIDSLSPCPPRFFVRGLAAGVVDYRPVRHHFACGDDLQGPGKQDRAQDQEGDHRELA